MQRLILMRHAEAEAPKPSLSDRDRPLSARGRADAAAMGRLLAEKSCRPDLALVSPALRTLQTWDLARDAFGDVEVHTPDGLYNAEAERLNRLVEEFEDQAGCLIVIAHNPGIHLLALRYLEDSAAAPSMVDKLAGGFPAGAAAIFSVDPAGRRVLDGYLHPPASR